MFYDKLFTELDFTLLRVATGQRGFPKESMGCTFIVMKHKTYDPGSGLLHWLHIMTGNAKAFILDSYHGLPKDNLRSYLDKFCFRFSRRSFGPALLDRLVLAISASSRLL